MQTTTDRFHEVAQGSVIPISWISKISFTKMRDNTINWFTLDQSVLDGVDLLATQDDNPLQIWDAYEYENVSDRMMEMTIQREAKFPARVQSAIADIKLNNFDDYFTYSENEAENSPISHLVLPNRPIALFHGIDGENIRSFVGTTQGMPQYSDDNTEVTWTSLDFLSEIGEQNLRQAVKLKDARTDEVIETILQQYGLTPDKYMLDQGYNTIPFVVFDKDKNAGNALLELVQAENGYLWMDENGIVRFVNRGGKIGATVDMQLTEKNIISIKPSREAEIINHVIIKSDVRKVQELQPIFSMENDLGYQSAEEEDEWRIGANRSFSIFLSLDDPSWSVENFVFNGDKTSSWITAKNTSGDAVQSNVTVSGTLFNDSYKLTINNNNSFAISIDALELWGEPAKIVDSINYEAYDTESIQKFGDKKLEITDNKFFGSYANCDTFAEDVLSKMAGYSPTLEVKIKGDPSLQGGDLINLNTKNYSGNFFIIGISQSLSVGNYETTLVLTKTKLTSPFILDVSVLDGTDVLS